MTSHVLGMVYSGYQVVCTQISIGQKKLHVFARC